jgi:hypothetical protein
MAFTISPGPVPEDHVDVDASTFMEAFVAGTDLGGFTADMFGADNSFVSTQTNPPDYKRGALWFKRGEGQLYFCDSPDQSTPSCYWTGMGPRKEILIRLYQIGNSRKWDALSLAPGDAGGTITRTLGTDGLGRETVRMRTFDPRAENAKSRGLCFAPILADSAASYAVSVYARAVLQGFTRLNVASGFSGTLNAWLMRRTTYPDTNTSEWNIGWPSVENLTTLTGASTIGLWRDGTTSGATDGREVSIFKLRESLFDGYRLT